MTRPAQKRRGGARPALYCALAIAAGGAVAQEEASEYEPLHIIVTAPAVEEPWRDAPMAVSVVEAGDLAGDQNLSLDRALERVPGVFAQNRYNHAQGLRLSIRGFGARASFGVRGVRVLVDGVPLTLPDGQTELGALDLDLLEQVEVIRGPASTLHGNAAGGVVAVRTRKPPAAPDARFNVSGGELGFRRIRGEAGGPVGGWRTLAAANATRLEGFRPLSDVETGNLTLKAKRRLGIGDLDLRFNAVDTEAEDPGALTAEQVDADRSRAAPRNLRFDAGETVEQQRLSGVWRAAIDPRRHVRLRGYAGRRDFANRLPFTGGGQVAFDRRFGGVGGRYTHSGRWLDRAQEVTAGFSVESQRDERRRFDNNDGARGELTLRQDETAESYGVFLQDEIALAPRLAVTLGVRYDRVRLGVDDGFLEDGDDSGARTLTDTSFSAGLGYRFTDSDHAYLRIASSFETPTINELANPDGGGFNPDLGPAEAVNAELGVKGERGDLRYQAAVFSIRVDDQLVPFELPDQPERTFFRNAGKSRRDGVELAAQWRFLPHWRIHVAYTLADYEFRRFSRDGTDFAGNRIPGTPRRRLFAGLAYERDGGYARIDVDLVGRRFADDANETRVSGYEVVDVRAGRRIVAGGWRWEPYIGINNLFDREYHDNLRVNAFGGRFFEPAPGRHAYLGIRASMR